MLQILFLSLFGVLPEPYDSVELDDKQAKQVANIAEKFDTIENQAKEKGGTSAALAKTVETIRIHRDDEIGKLLTKDQKAKLAELKKQMKEGIPIGKGLVRSYRIYKYNIPSAPRFMSPEEAWKAAVIAANTPPDGIMFIIKNCSGNDCKAAVISIQLFNAKGVRVDSRTERISDLKDKESQELIILCPPSDLTRAVITTEDFK